MMNQVERGVTVSDPIEMKNCARGGLVTTYHTRQMSSEQLQRYGLERYITDGKAVKDVATET